MGHYYSGMLDIMTDVTLVSIAFGTHVELLEVDELSALCAEASDAEIAQRLAEFHARLRCSTGLPAGRVAASGANLRGSRRVCPAAWP